LTFRFSGFVIPFNQDYLFAWGPEAKALGEPLFGEPVYLRPGYRLWDAPAQYLLPHTVVDDIGQQFEAPACYDWLETRGDLFPRSDAIGYLAASGEQRSVFIKELDLADMAAFASPHPTDGPFVRVSLAIEARAVPDEYALLPISPPIPLLDRALPSYRLSPGVFGAVGAVILNQLLASGRHDWSLTYDQLDDMTGGL
jgi:hypothetical protein